MERPGFATGSAHRTLLSYHADSGRLTTLQDGNDSIVTQSFDSAGRLLERSVAPGAGVSVLATKEKFEYDTLGVLKRMETDQQTGGSVFLAGVNLTTDTLNRLTKESFTYWGIDATRPVEITSGYTFSSGGGTSDDPSFRRSLSHGSAGALAWGGSNLSVETTPDAIGRLDKVRVTPDGGSAFDLATYRWAGSQPVQRVLTYGAAGPGGPAHTQTTTFGYDDYRRLTGIADKRDGQGSPYSAFTFAWDPAGNLLKEIYAKKQGGAGDRFNYDGFDRVVGTKLGAVDMSAAYGTDTCAKEIVYNLDPGNSRTSVVETISGGGTTTTSYGIYNDSYRYQSVGQVSPQYDNEGNLYYDGRCYYVYDFKNRLSEIWVATQGTQAMTTQQRLSAAKQKNAPQIPVAKQVLLDTRKKVLDRFNGGLEHPIKKHKELQSQGLLDAQGTTQNSETFTLSLAAVYGYDPMNRRILRIIPGVLDHRYAYDRWREVSEITPVAAPNDGVISPLVLKDFVWGSRIDELLSYRRQVAYRTWEAFYATQGKLDNVVALHKEDGTLVETVEYDPYGKASVFVGSSTTPQDASSVENPYLFQGRRLDEETGFLYFRNRYLHTGWGRFITNDPIGNWGDAANLGNGVGFVGNAASQASDPMGLDSLFDSGAPIEIGDGPISAPGMPGLPPGVVFSTGPGGSGQDKTPNPCGCGGASSAPRSGPGHAPGIVIPFDPENDWTVGYSSYMPDLEMTPNGSGLQLATGPGWLGGSVGVLTTFTADGMLGDGTLNGTLTQQTVYSSASGKATLFGSPHSQPWHLAPIDSAQLLGHFVPPSNQPTLEDLSEMAKTVHDTLFSTAVGYGVGVVASGIARGLAAGARLGTRQLCTVSRWGRVGLRPGDWVMKGPANRWNYLRSFKWERTPFNRPASFSSGRQYTVPSDSVHWPPGWEKFKGIFGQRIYRP